MEDMRIDDDGGATMIHRPDLECGEVAQLTLINPDTMSTDSYSPVASTIDDGQQEGEATEGDDGTVTDRCSVNVDSHTNLSNPGPGASTSSDEISDTQQSDNETLTKQVVEFIPSESASNLNSGKLVSGTSDSQSMKFEHVEEVSVKNPDEQSNCGLKAITDMAENESDSFKVEYIAKSTRDEENSVADGSELDEHKDLAGNESGDICQLEQKDNAYRQDNSIVDNVEVEESQDEMTISVDDELNQAKSAEEQEKRTPDLDSTEEQKDTTEKLSENKLEKCRKRSKKYYGVREKIERTSKHIAEHCLQLGGKSSPRNRFRVCVVKASKSGDTSSNFVGASSLQLDPTGLCKPVMLKLYDVGRHMRGKRTVCLKKRKGRRAISLQNIMLISANQAPTVRVATRTCDRQKKFFDIDSELAPLPRLRVPVNTVSYREDGVPEPWEDVEVDSDLPSHPDSRLSMCVANHNESKDAHESREDSKQAKVLSLSQKKSTSGRYVYTLSKDDDSTSISVLKRKRSTADDGRSEIEDYMKSNREFSDNYKIGIEYSMDKLAMVLSNVQDVDKDLSKVSVQAGMAASSSSLAYCSVCHLRQMPVAHIEGEHICGNYFCHLCGTVFQTQLARNLHSSIHVKPTRRATMRCSICDLIFAGPGCEADLRAHVLENHKAGLHGPCIPCPLCNETFIERSMMRLHVDTHKPIWEKCTCNKRSCYSCSFGPSIYKADTVPYEEMTACGLCQLRFVNVSRHEDDNHHIIANSPFFRCPVCDVKFSQKAVAELHLKVHMKSRPSVPTYMACSLCNITTQSLADHVQECHRKAHRNMPCRYCSVVVQEEGLLFLHERSHWPQGCNCGRSACKTCFSSAANDDSDSVETDESLVRMDAFSECKIKKTECCVCKLRFINAKLSETLLYTATAPTVADLKNHIKVEHASRSKFRCSVCRAGFLHRNMAQFHLHVHTGLQLPVRNICSLCKEKPESDICNHVLLEHRTIPLKNQFKCAVCCLVLPEENMYRLHLLSHLPPAPPPAAEADDDSAAAAANQETDNETDVFLSPLEDASRTIQFGSSTARSKTMRRACQVCYMCVDNMEAHAAEHRPNKARFRCRVCKVTFQTEVMSSTHARIHCYKYPNISLRCTLCRKAFNTGNALIDHCLSMHPIDETDWTSGWTAGLVCSICQAVFPEENSLQAHKIQHVPKYCRCGNKECRYCSYFTCKHCGEFFNPGLKNYFLQHAEHCNQLKETKTLGGTKSASSSTSSQVIKIARVTPYQRSDVGQTSEPAPSRPPSALLPVQKRTQVYPSTSSNAVLIDSDSDDPKASGDAAGSTECVSCGVQIKSGTIAEHLRRHHNKPVDLFKCKECSFAAPSAETLLRHRLMHMSCNFFHCLFCSDHFYKWEDLLSHNYTFHFPLQHRCNLCAMYFTDLALLQKHNKMNNLKTIAGVPCNFCCRSFDTDADYQAHRRHHGASCNCGQSTCHQCNKFRCSCSAVFKAHQFLQYLLHMRSCYQCYGCELNFDRLPELEAHELAHYVTCGVCGARRKTEAQLTVHLATHNCQCPADNADCLFCKKAWCTVCGQRFVKSELASYSEHKLKCADSTLLCICGENDCSICQHAKCVYCQRLFKKHRFESFSSHVRACMGESPDPFAPPSSKQIKIKDEPIDLEYTRRRKVVDRTVIDLDSGSELEKDDQDQSDMPPNTSESTSRSEQFSAESIIEIENVSEGHSVSMRVEQDDASATAEDPRPGDGQDMDRLVFGSMDSFGATEGSELINVMPNQSTELVPQPSTSYAYDVYPQHFDSPLESTFGSGQPGVICVAPIGDDMQNDVSQEPRPKIINICPEEDDDVSGLGAMDDLIMNEYAVDPVAKIDPAVGFSVASDSAVEDMEVDNNGASNEISQSWLD